MFYMQSNVELGDSIFPLVSKVETLSTFHYEKLYEYDMPAKVDDDGKAQRLYTMYLRASGT